MLNMRSARVSAIPISFVEICACTTKLRHAARRVLGEPETPIKLYTAPGHTAQKYQAGVRCLPPGTPLKLYTVATPTTKLKSESKTIEFAES